MRDSSLKRLLLEQGARILTIRRGSGLGRGPVVRRPRPRLRPSSTGVIRDNWELQPRHQDDADEILSAPQQ